MDLWCNPRKMRQLPDAAVMWDIWLVSYVLVLSTTTTAVDVVKHGIRAHVMHEKFDEIFNEKEKGCNFWESGGKDQSNPTSSLSQPEEVKGKLWWQSAGGSLADGPWFVVQCWPWLKIIFTSKMIMWMWFRQWRGLCEASRSWVCCKVVFAKSNSWQIDHLGSREIFHMKHKSRDDVLYILLIKNE